MMRGDVELYKDDPIYAKAQKDIAPKIQGFPNPRQVAPGVKAMWSEFEGSLSSSAHRQIRSRPRRRR